MKTKLSFMFKEITLVPKLFTHTRARVGGSKLSLFLLTLMEGFAFCWFGNFFFKIIVVLLQKPNDDTLVTCTNVA